MFPATDSDRPGKLERTTKCSFQNTLLSAIVLAAKDDWISTLNRFWILYNTSPSAVTSYSTTTLQCIRLFVRFQLGN